MLPFAGPIRGPEARGETMTAGNDAAAAAPRANMAGHPCPPWCRTDHTELLVPSKPRFGHMAGHYSDPVGDLPGAPGTVHLELDPADDASTVVSVDLAPAVRLPMTPGQALALSAVLEGDGNAMPARLLRLASHLRTAAMVAEATS